MSGELGTVAELMAIAARTAPKSAGKDFMVVEIVEGETLRTLADRMEEFGGRTGKGSFDRDAANVRDSAAVVLIGLKDAKAVGLNCGACGYERCPKINAFEKEFRGPQCAFRLLDMGIALGSAVKTASLLNVDNRIMYRIGPPAMELGLVDADVVMDLVPFRLRGRASTSTAECQPM